MNKLKNAVLKFSNEITECRLGAYASSSAFFVFLSLIPVIVLIVAVLPLLNVSLDLLLDFIYDIMPEYIASFIKDILFEMNNGTVTVVSISIIITLWSAGKGVYAMIAGLNSVYEVKEKRNFFILRLLGALYIVLFLALIIFVLVAIVWGKIIVNVILRYIPGLKLITDFLINCRFILIWALLIFVFQVMYSFFPNTRLPFFAQLPGALFASIGWTALSYGFSVYLQYFGVYTIYGSLTTIVFTMIWLYYDIYIILLGGVINKLYSSFILSKRK